jgi:hypothetical protein
LVLLGSGFIWVALNAAHNSFARKIDSTYKLFTAIPTKVYFVSGGALLIGFGLLLLLEFI